MRLRDWDAETTASRLELWNSVRQSTTTAYLGLAALLSPDSGATITASLLEHLCGSNNRKLLYSKVGILKRNGQTRQLLVPRSKLKWVQRSINHTFSQLTERSKSVKGFERGESIVTHANLHVGRRWILVIDIKDFFPSISWGRVYGMFQSYPFSASADIARILTNLTVYDNQLPQGSPSSPLLANMICRSMDSLLIRWARKNGYYYSRYADDLTFSTNKNKPSDFQMNEIFSIINRSGFLVNEEKTRLIGHFGRQLVTGLVVNGSRANVKREVYRNLRALLHNVERFGWQAQINRKIFPNEETINSYKNGSLSKSDLDEVRTQKKLHHYLLGTVSGRIRGCSIDEMQRIVRGNIEFLGQVCGRESSRYKSLHTKLHRLCLSAPLPEVGSIKLMNDGIEVANETYGRFRSKVLEIRSGTEHKQIETLRQLLNEYKHVPELLWLSGEYASNFETYRAKTLGAFFSSHQSASDGVEFFRSFLSDSHFRGLLHPPMYDSISVTEMLQNCEDALIQHRHALPNHLKDLVRSFLNQTKLVTQKNPQQHPWNFSEFKREFIYAFKKNTRFDTDPEERESTSLEMSLQRCINTATAESSWPSVSVNLNVRNTTTIYGDVLPIVSGLENIIQSMVSNCTTKKIEINGISPQDPIKHIKRRINTELLCLDIVERGSCIKREPEISKMFNGKLRNALKQLRGHVDWQIVGHFLGKGYYEIDVMNNQCERLADVPPTGWPGFRHRVIFHILA